MDKGCMTKRVPSGDTLPLGSRTVILWMCVLLSLSAKAGDPAPIEPASDLPSAAKAGLCLVDNWCGVSPVALVADKQGKTLYVAESTANQVAVFDIDAGRVTKEYCLPDSPSGLALAPNGLYLYVTSGADEGRVHVVNLQAEKVCCTLPVGHTPTAPVISPDGRFLYVCNRFNNNVSVINLGTQKEVARIPVLREPVAVAITPDGKFLFVANHLPVGAADRGYIAAAVSVIDTAAKNVATTIELPNGSVALRGICISPDGQHVYVTHILARYTVPTTQLEQGWMNTNALSIIDAKNKELIDTVLLDDVDNGAANPWAVGCTSDGKYICATHAGTHELSIINASALLNKISSIENLRRTPYSGASRNENELSFLYGIRQRVKLCGKGPRALAIVGSKIYVAEYFTDSITKFEIQNSKFKIPFALSLVSRDPMEDGRRTKDVRRRGEMLFHDATICFQQWQSCASCHPDEGRVDGLNWDLLNDGIGNPKNTKSLLFSHQTPPAMITGLRSRAETAVRAGIRHILFAVRPEAEATAIDEYLKSLQPVPSPYLVDGKLSESARRGQKVFEKAGCASCHSGPLYTDLQRYDVGTGKGLDKGRQFDTPTLVEVWRTAPYLYDGRAATIKEVLTMYNKDDKHGLTSNLTERQINDLAEFILSL
ncbi:MAG: beta-propeller fold lactonase family protein [Sedimentisphaerales bacterium]